MATWLKQSTAVEIKLGPFVDSVDGVSPETSLTISQADVRLAKNGGDWAQKNESTTLVHEENGWYRCLLDTTDTNTLGIVIVAVNEAGALPVWREFLVVPANVYDSVLGADLLQVDTREVGGTTQTAGDIIADTNDLQTRIPAALVSGRMSADVQGMAGNSDSPSRLDRSARAIVKGTVTAGASTTSIPTSSLDPAAAVTDQFKDRDLIFDQATTTTALRGQRTRVTASTAGGVLTVTALTTAPASGDTFTLV